MSDDLSLRLQGAEATIRVHEFTIRQVSTERDGLRSQVATLQAERDAARRERDKAHRVHRSLTDRTIEAKAERDRLKAALFPFAYLTGAKLDCGDCGRTVPNCNRRDELRTPKDTVCRGPAARRALAAPLPTPPAGTPPDDGECHCKYCEVTAMERARRFPPATPPAAPETCERHTDCDAADAIAQEKTGDRADHGSYPEGYTPPAVQGEPPRCPPMCGREELFETAVTGGIAWWRNGRSFCCAACYDAQRPLHPREGEQGRCGTCGGERRVLWVYPRGPGDPPGNNYGPCPTCRGTRPPQETRPAPPEGPKEGR